MPYRITWEDHGIYVRYSGIVSVDEVLAYASEVEADARFDDVRYSLNDFSACTGMIRSGPALELLAAGDYGASASNPSVKIAVVTDRQDVVELLRAYLTVGLNRYPVRVFPTLAEARNWIAIPPASEDEGTGRPRQP